MVDHESRKCLLPLLAEHLDHQQWQKMMGCDDPTTAVWRCTNPCKDKHSVTQSKLMSTFSKIYLQFMMMKISFLLFNCLPTYLQFSSQPYQTFSWLLGIILRSPLRTACSHKHKMHNKIVKELMIYEPIILSKWMQIKHSKNVVIIVVIDNATVSEAFFWDTNYVN